MMNVQSLVDRLRSVLEVYYDWVQVDADEEGVVRIRVGKRNPTDRDVEEFKLRVGSETKDGYALSDVRFRRGEGEIVGAVCPSTGDKEAADKFSKSVREFDNDVDVKEDYELELSRFVKVPSKAFFSRFECSDMDEAKERLGDVQKFLGKHGFERVEEGQFDDSYVSPEGMMARVSLVAAPTILPTVCLAVYAPKNLSEANVVRRYFGLSEAAAK